MSASSSFLAEKTLHPIEIGPYNLTEAKNTLDDALKQILMDDFGFAEKTTHTDVKLLLGYLSVIVAAYASIYSYNVAWPLCRTELVVGVAGYFVLSGLLTAYMYWVEGNILFVGIKDGGLEPDSRVVVKGRMTRYSPLYSITLEYTSPAGAPPLAPQTTLAGSSAPPSRLHPKSKGFQKALKSRKMDVKTLNVDKSIGNYFDTEGRFVPEAFLDDVTAWVAAKKE